MQANDGTWSIVCGDETIKAGFDSNAAAWRWLDRQAGEVISPSEKRAAYWWDCYVAGD